MQVALVIIPQKGIFVMIQASQHLLIQHISECKVSKQSSIFLLYSVHFYCLLFFLQFSVLLKQIGERCDII